jgi:YVTN family beta-propeller protein
MRNAIVALGLLFGDVTALAGQVPGAAASPDIAITKQDRVYTADQFSNTISVVDPAANRLLGVIRLGDPVPANLSPLYKGQLLVHGLGFSPDHRTLAVVSIGSNSVTFIDTATSSVAGTTYIGRSPHEAFFTPSGKEVWVTVRGENYIAVLDGRSHRERARIEVPNGPGMTIFSPDGRYAYVCSSFTPETVAIDAAAHRIVGHVKQDSPFCPNIAATPDGEQVWLTLKDSGRVMVFQARPPFRVLTSIDTGPLTNHVNIVRSAGDQLAYVTIGGLNLVRVFRTRDFQPVAEIAAGPLPHGVWPSGDGKRVYVGLENGDALAAIDTASNQVIARIPIGQGPQAVVYVPRAVRQADGTTHLEALGAAVAGTQVTLAGSDGKPTTSVTLFDQGLVQYLQAAVAGLPPKQPFVLALSASDGSALEPLAAFTTNAAGAAVVNAVGPIRQIISSGGDARAPRRSLVIVSGAPNNLGPPVQRQSR